MIDFPWVSRRAYVEVRDERNRLRERVDGLTEDLVRIKRHETGLNERRPQARAKAPEPTIPPNLRNLISGFENPLVQQQLEHEIKNQLRAGKSPDDLDGYLRSELGIAEA